MIENKIAVVIRGETLEIAEKTAEACVEGGILSLEVTFTVPGAANLMESLSQKFPHALVGGGTVLDSETARVAILAGAKFIVSPSFDEATAKLCNRYQIPYIPGCMTIKEMITALEYGASVVKLFPGQVYEPSFIKNVKGPLPHVNVMPTGGININNVQEWLNAGAVMVGVGGEITRPANSGNYKEVTKLAKEFVHAIKSEGASE